MATKKNQGKLPAKAPYGRASKGNSAQVREALILGVASLVSRALDALQATTKAFLVDILQAINLSAIHRKCVTIQAKDVKHIISVSKILALYSKILQDLPA
ncbi:hypothetical protein CC80DRAFT_506934 [Byssothecium circinans]|uniref:Core Histone H2A/H2B/H3 domain-containing protein n=1 Tax=Byssothecium circinans TaxID=147558 RepID=A0A6A5TPW5_9PLEO|nr:hypothetical protein CC80DRAFT_506934 [Byssothecium circinans]